MRKEGLANRVSLACIFINLVQLWPKWLFGLETVVPTKLGTTGELYWMGYRVQTALIASSVKVRLGRLSPEEELQSNSVSFNALGKR